ncbi:hypothetical protein BLOT_003464 [Blomia tropicalis]|nr:hypothetical protein BLOT_003464 [Blomia tropicalis]
MMGSIIVCRKRRQTNNSQQYSTTTIIREQHLSYSTIFITFLLLFQCITLTSPKDYNFFG